MRVPTAHTLRSVELAGRQGWIAPLDDVTGLARLPFSLRVLLENLIRRQALSPVDISREVRDLLARRRGAALSFHPSRVFGQDILGKVMLVDLAALRDALREAGIDPELAAPKIPVDIIIDHSLQVDVFATRDAPRLNLEHEYRRNRERFQFLRWCTESFSGVRVVPPGKGIMHQLHLESIGRVVWEGQGADGTLFSPDTCVGTDSHTPMINGLGVLGWGVGGIEAEAAMLGRGIAMALPEVVGVEVRGRLSEGVSPTDLVLWITERLRTAGVVDCFVEFFGADLDLMPVPDRGTIANMAPEYGATSVYFPIDRRTIDYLTLTGRDPDHVASSKPMRERNTSGATSTSRRLSSIASSHLIWPRSARRSRGRARPRTATIWIGSQASSPRMSRLSPGGRSNPSRRLSRANASNSPTGTSSLPPSPAVPTHRTRRR